MSFEVVSDNVLMFIFREEHIQSVYLISYVYFTYRQIFKSSWWHVPMYIPVSLPSPTLSHRIASGTCLFVLYVNS